MPNVHSPVDHAAPRAEMLGRRWSGRRFDRRALNLFGYALVAPLVITMALVIAYPLINEIISSFRDERIIGSPSSFVGFNTYETVLGDKAFWSALGRSGIWLVLNLLLQTILGLGTAVLLESKSWWSRTARTWIVLPWAIPSVAVTVTWQWLLNSNYGAVYRLLEDLGIGVGAPLGGTTSALITIILINSWHWFPLGAVVIYGALATVPHEIVESARVDGASAWRLLFAIKLPMIRPVLFALGIVGSLWSFNILDTIYLITKGGPADGTTTIPVYIYNTAFTAFRSSQASAASVLTIVILVTAVLLVVRSAQPEDTA